MAVGFGADPVVTASGVTVGTTAADIRKIFGALYTPGIISGGTISTSASRMMYTVSEGVAAFPMASGEVVLGYWPAVNNLIPASTITPRTDYIYAYQQTPSGNNDANIRVEIGSRMPENQAVLLGVFVYQAGATASDSGVRSVSLDYSIPYGTSQGELARVQNTLEGTFGDTRVVIANKSIYLPTDRRVTVKLQTTLSTSHNGGVGFSNSVYAEASYVLKIDGAQKALWKTQGLHQAIATYAWDETFTLSAGTHIISVDRAREVGPGTPYQHYQAGSYIGALVSVLDSGVVK